MGFQDETLCRNGKSPSIYSVSTVQWAENKNRRWLKQHQRHFIIVPAHRHGTQLLLWGDGKNSISI